MKEVSTSHSKKLLHYLFEPFQSYIYKCAFDFFFHLKSGVDSEFDSMCRISPKHSEKFCVFQDNASIGDSMRVTEGFLNGMLSKLSIR